MARGFILQPTYRLDRGRPVVHLWGRLEDGRPFLVRDTRQEPRFWVLQRDAERCRRLGANVRDDDRGRRTMRDEAVAVVAVVAPSDTPPVRDRLIAAGVPTFEADVRFAYRYLIDHGIRGSLEIEGDSHKAPGGEAVFDDPQVRPGDWTPALRVLSLDIETDPHASRLLSVGLAGCGAAEVLLLTPRGRSCPPGAVACRDERELLRTLLRRVHELDPDVITGWNVVDFDLMVLERLARRHGLPLALGRTREPLRIRRAASPRGAGAANVAGRLVLDGIDLLRGSFLRFESYSLQAVSREVLGRGKTITGRDRAEEILRAFEHDRPRLVEYNLNDARLVLEILESLQLVELAVERSKLTGMPPDRVAASIAAFDFVYLSELGRRGIVAPTVRAAEWPAEATHGGHVLEPLPGLYRNVLVFDFRSLYPSIIRTFQIDPLGRLPEPSDDDDPIVAPNGAAFRREPGILPRMLDELFPRREEARRTGNRARDRAIKILMNSFYGVLGTPACRFASPALANAITGFGREVLLWTRERVEQAGHRVLYGDTDSLFVLAGTDDPQAARELGTRLVVGLNRDLATHVTDSWRVESRLELEFERLYLRLLLPALRHGKAGARKRYAGLIDEGGERTVVFTGMEVVRRDWTELARRVQRELYRRLFDDRPVEDYLREVVGDLRAGRLDDLLVYRKTLRKRLDEYTASTPPHVAAARKLESRPRRRVVYYVITGNGPEPAAERRSPIDHEHYVQRQVRPVAEPVLELLGLEFDRVIGDDTQMRLF